jgi:hypothetical protein
MNRGIEPPYQGPEHVADGLTRRSRNAFRAPGGFTAITNVSATTDRRRGLSTSSSPSTPARYVCGPRSPWQRESKNTNGGLRSYFLKSSDSQCSRRGLDTIVRSLNARSRWTLGWATPTKAFVDAVALTGRGDNGFGSPASPQWCIDRCEFPGARPPIARLAHLRNVKFTPLLIRLHSVTHAPQARPWW